MNPLDQLLALVEELENAETLPSFSVSNLTDLGAKLAQFATLYKAVKADASLAASPELVAALSRISAVAVAGQARHAELSSEAAALLEQANTADSSIEDALGAFAETEAPVEPPVEPNLATPPPGADATEGVTVTPVDHEEAERLQAEADAATPAHEVSETLPPPAPLDALQAASPVPAKPLVGNGIKASAGLSNVGVGQDLAENQLGVAFKDLHTAMQVRPVDGDGHYELGTKVRIGTVEPARNARTVFAADGENKGLSDDELIEKAVAGASRIGVAQVESLKASGGPCAGPEPDFAITVLGGDTSNSFIDTLPKVVNNRKLSYYPWLKFSMASRPAAATTTVPGNFNKITTAQDTAGYYPGTLSGQPLTDAIAAGQALQKGCIHIDCPSPSVQDYHAIYQCLTIGNFINISFPEYVAAWKTLMGAHFEVSRQEDAIATVVGASRILNVTADIFGANRDLFSIIARFVASIRGDLHDDSVPISLYFPAYTNMWLADDDYKQMFHDEMMAIQKIAANIPNLRIGYYDVSAGTTAAGSPTVLPALPTGAGTTAGLQTWPSQMRVIAFPTGGVFQQAVGNLQFGLRETGMATNDFSMFTEIFESTLLRTNLIYSIDVKLCPQGEAAGSSVVAC